MNILETIQNNDMLKIALILVAAYLFMTYYKENLDNTPTTIPTTPVTQTLVTPPSNSLSNNGPAPQDSAQQDQINKIVAGPTALTTKDLLPAYSDATDFAKQNPVSKLLAENNYLQSGFHMGINSVIQSNKIPYLDLRSCPPIPKQTVGPWGQSSFEQPAGFGRRMLEIGI
jgi:hypothetical protein